MIGRIQEILGATRTDCCRISARRFRRRISICRDRISSIASLSASDRPTRVLVNLQQLFGSGRLASTGYVSILPVDQGIEHSAGASFAPNPLYFDPENIVKLAIEGGCNAVASRSACSAPSRASTRTRFRS